VKEPQTGHADHRPHVDRRQRVNDFDEGELRTMTVTTDAIILRIAHIMIDELKLEDVTPETFDPDIDLVDEVGIDSMDLATVALVLRDEYAVRIDEDDYPTLTTVRLIAEYIQRKLAG
jgi:acyl carrier protein